MLLFLGEYMTDKEKLDMWCGRDANVVEQLELLYCYEEQAKQYEQEQKELEKTKENK